MMNRTHVLVILGLAAFCIVVRFNGWHEGILNYKFVPEYTPSVGELREASKEELRDASKEGLRDEIFLIPRDDDLKLLGTDERAAVYWRYVNTMQALCREQGRFGSFKDGGKEICLDSDFRPNKPCLVYSFGSNWNFEFEVAIIEAFGCEVHTFDPSMNLNQKGKSIPKDVTFHPIGLGGSDHVAKNNWKIETLSTIIAELGHSNRTVDILKMDIEGAEWSSLPQMFEAGTLRAVKQLDIEFHYQNQLAQLKVFRGLYDAGFRIFMREHNPVQVQPIKSKFHKKYTPLNELAFINKKFRQSLI